MDGFYCDYWCWRGKNNFFGCAESYEEAKSAIEMMRPLSSGNTIYFWENLGEITVLSLVCKTDEARKFCCSWLGRIIRDGEQNRDMLSALRSASPEARRRLRGGVCIYAECHGKLPEPMTAEFVTAARLIKRTTGEVLSAVKNSRCCGSLPPKSAVSWPGQGHLAMKESSLL